MSWSDRPYAQDETGGAGTGQVRRRGSGLPGLNVATMIIIANVVVHVLVYSTSPQLGGQILDFGLMQAEAVLHGQVWRLLTATYLHAPGFNHVFFNMLGLYFFGPALERVWGARQFFLAYTAGGVAGNILLTLAGLVGFIDPLIPGLGASGSVLTMLGACAVLFPNARVYIYFLFPIRIRTFVALYGIWFLYNIWKQGANFGGDLCHLGGLILGLWWAYRGRMSMSGRQRIVVDPASLLGKVISRHGANRAGRQGTPDEEEVDRILKKVSRDGVESLTSQERQVLIDASRRRR